MKARCPRREEKEQQMEQSEEQEVDEVVQYDEKETARTEEEFTVVKKQKRKERVSSPLERQKKKTKVDKEVEKEVVKEIEMEVEKEVEKEIEEQLEKKETVSSILVIPVEEEVLGNVERQQHEETATLTKMEEDKDREKAPRDGGNGNLGTVTNQKTSNGWVSVQWDVGHTNLYRVGYDNSCDLIIVGHNYTQCIVQPQNDTLNTSLIFPSDKIPLISNVFHYCQRKLTSSRSDRIISFTLLWYSEVSCNITVYEGKYVLHIH
uniref:MIB/HERC2 domain-containing protein n=1 Tax=Octopus bimaculoides TaxID=37653 RepID=A0A0L8HDP7_OCTBM